MCRAVGLAMGFHYGILREPICPHSNLPPGSSKRMYGLAIGSARRGNGVKANASCVGASAAMGVLPVQAEAPVTGHYSGEQYGSVWLAVLMM
jgi:hypothetical protein